MKKCWVIVFLLIGLMTLTGCNNKEKDVNTADITYVNEKFGFSLVFPSSWKDKYTVEEADNLVKIQHKPTWLKTKEGTLFTIMLFTPKEKWDSEGKELSEMIGLQKLYESDQEVFGFSRPTDVQNILDDQRLRDEYSEMEKEVSAIIKTFKKIN